MKRLGDKWVQYCGSCLNRGMWAIGNVGPGPGRRPEANPARSTLVFVCTQSRIYDSVDTTARDCVYSHRLSSPTTELAEDLSQAPLIASLLYWFLGPDLLNSAKRFKFILKKEGNHLHLLFFFTVYCPGKFSHQMQITNKCSLSNRNPEQLSSIYCTISVQDWSSQIFHVEKRSISFSVWESWLHREPLPYYQTQPPPPPRPLQSCLHWTHQTFSPSTALLRW